jgi:hypothetical protein
MKAPVQATLFEVVTVQRADWFVGWQHQQKGMAVAEAGTDPWWRSCCDAGIAYLASLEVPFDAYALAELGVPEPSSSNHWGPRLSAAAKAGLIARVGYQPSRRPRTALSAVSVWQGCGTTLGVRER